MVWLNISKERKCNHDLIGSFVIKEGKDEILGLPFANNAGIVLWMYSCHLLVTVWKFPQKYQLFLLILQATQTTDFHQSAYSNIGGNKNKWILTIFTGHENDAASHSLLVQHEQDSDYIESTHIMYVKVVCFSCLNLPHHKQSTYYSLSAYSTISPLKQSIGSSELPSCLLNVLAQTCLPCQIKIYLFQHGSLRHTSEFWLNS